MAQATFSVRMDEGLKAQFDSLCQEFGMNTSTAINVFARAVVRQRRIPFEISAPESKVTRQDALKAFQAMRAQAKAADVTDKPLDEINEEIRQTRISLEKES